MKANEKRAWRLFVDELPWLVEADRPLMELVCGFRGMLMNGGGLPTASSQVYSAMLSKLGATPVDRSRTQPRAEETMIDEFFDD